MNEILRREIVRFSKSKKDESVFSPYIMQRFMRFISDPNHEDLIAYAGAITEDKIPVLFTGNGHMISRTSQRLGIMYPAIVVAEIIEIVEKNETLANLLLESEMMAYEKNYDGGLVALYVEELDIFCYLITNNSEVRIGTVVSGLSKYFANDESDFICTLMANGDLVFGFEGSRKLARSANTKYSRRKITK